MSDRFISHLGRQRIASTIFFFLLFFIFPWILGKYFRHSLGQRIVHPMVFLDGTLLARLVP